MKRSEMKVIKAVVEKSSKVLASKCYVADEFAHRVIGLMGEKNLDETEGLLIKRCNSIHTFFMNFPIDAVFLNREGIVLAVHHDVKPWRIDMPVFGANSVLELRSGAATGLTKGERLCLN